MLPNIARAENEYLPFPPPDIPERMKARAAASVATLAPITRERAGSHAAHRVKTGVRSPAQSGIHFARPARRRLSSAERESQIVASAIAFFSDRGLDGQMRDLAKSIGVTHTLLYHYFPTKQALIDRVYVELFEGLWNPAWDRLLDDASLSADEKLYRFYCDYARAIFHRDFVRILVFSGLSDRTIPDRFFVLLRERLFPRLIRETRKHCGVTSRARPSARELELMMGLHGGIFYTALRRFVYGQAVHTAEAAEYDEIYIRDRVASYLLAAPTVLHAPVAKPVLQRRVAA